ncbi:MAG: hypothetical protein JXJ20_03355 [Anaerolineae bacterium]|jgi:hypothetical protein|nr:hypothetical protein [Anaerolineae bacterium]
MDNISLHQFLTVYVWFGLSTILFLFALIARFYERLSGQRTYYRLFTIPALAFTGATIRLASLDQVTNDMVGDGFLAIGGVSLAVLCLHVYRLMTSGR